MKRVALLAVLLVGAGLALGATPAAAVDRGYEQSIVATRGLVREAINGSRDRVPDAIRTLENGTGSSQPEVLADLRATPPDLQDADARLAAIEAALNRPGDAGDPVQARHDVQRIIDLPRYDSMRGSLTLWDRFVAWALQLLAGLLFYLVTRTSLSPPFLAALAGLLVLVAAAAIGLITRSSWTRASRSTEAQEERLRAAIRDRFLAADRLGEEGEYSRALRELVAAVAGEVGNRPFWDSSPLTVRELFAREGLLAELGPLLQPFEASVYGRREVTARDFERALIAASRFRSAPAAVAA